MLGLCWHLASPRRFAKEDTVARVYSFAFGFIRGFFFAGGTVRGFHFAFGSVRGFFFAGGTVRGFLFAYGSVRSFSFPYGSARGFFFAGGTLCGFHFAFVLARVYSFAYGYVRDFQLFAGLFKVCVSTVCSVGRLFHVLFFSWCSVSLCCVCLPVVASSPVGDASVFIHSILLQLASTVGIFFVGCDSEWSRILSHVLRFFEPLIAVHLYAACSSCSRCGEGASGVV